MVDQEKIKELQKEYEDILAKYNMYKEKLKNIEYEIHAANLKVTNEGLKELRKGYMISISLNTYLDLLGYTPKNTNVVEIMGWVDQKDLKLWHCMLSDDDRIRSYMRYGIKDHDDEDLSFFMERLSKNVSICEEYDELDPKREHFNSLLSSENYKEAINYLHDQYKDYSLGLSALLLSDYDKYEERLFTLKSIKESNDSEFNLVILD